MLKTGTHPVDSKNWTNNPPYFKYEVDSQICINIHPDAVPPIHAESYHVATDEVPAQTNDKFRTQTKSGGHIGSSVVRTRCSAGPVLPLWVDYYE